MILCTIDKLQMLTWIDKGSSHNVFTEMLFVISLKNIYNVRKNRMQVHCMINYNSLLALFALNVVYGIVLVDGSTWHLNHLLQKSLKYKHHKENYIRSLTKEIVPVGLHLNKKPAYVPVSENFEEKWKTVYWKQKKIQYDFF